MASSPRSFYDVDDETTKTDVGSQPGTSWTLSSFKPGSGVKELRSADMSKLWQSDGLQPHLITLTFSQLTELTHLSLYLDVRQDDSYTPTKLTIKAGTSFSDLIPVRTRTFDAPQGWKHFALSKTDLSVSEEDEEQHDARSGGGRTRRREAIRCWIVQVAVLANHLNGKDTHVRRCMVFGPPARRAGERQGVGSAMSGSEWERGREDEADREGARFKRGRMEEHEAVQRVSRALAGFSETQGDRQEADDDAMELDQEGELFTATRRTMGPGRETAPIRTGPLALDQLLARSAASTSSVRGDGASAMGRGLSRFGNIR